MHLAVWKSWVLEYAHHLEKMDIYGVTAVCVFAFYLLVVLISCLSPSMGVWGLWSCKGRR